MEYTPPMHPIIIVRTKEVHTEHATGVLQILDVVGYEPWMQDLPRPPAVGPELSPDNVTIDWQLPVDAIFTYEASSTATLVIWGEGSVQAFHVIGSRTLVAQNEGSTL